RRSSDLCGGGDVEQVAGVAGAVAGRTDDGVVACGLGKRGELSRQPPGERMKPVQATIDFGKQRHGAVEPLNVHLLVSQDGAALRWRPIAPRGREQNLRLKQA